MASLDTSRNLSQSAVFADFFSRVAHDVFGPIVAWNDARRTRNCLEALTAAELDDIGLTRADIDAMVGPRRIF